MVYHLGQDGKGHHYPPSEIGREDEQSEVTIRKAPKRCKKCRKELAGGYTEVTEDRELVVVDKQTQEPLTLNKEDMLCPACNSGVDYYRRIRG